MACKKKTKLWEPMGKDEMKTTTQRMFEESAKAFREISDEQRKLINITSLNLKHGDDGSSDDEDIAPMVSSYTRQYSRPYPPRCKPLQPKGETPDPLFNRRPKNDFEFSTGLAFKFLDDHMHNISETRRKVNFFRQLR
ncbi:hypothetical protein KR018_007243 [Drosophila ironensis]|nr:hypothetical protein KR018_007243 [Drosophila ironensis]